MPISGTTTVTVEVTDFTTVFSYDGDTFDANQIRSPTVLSHDGQYNLYYGGLPFWNNIELGLATSGDGYDFDRYSNDPIMSPSEEPWYASFSIYPTTAMYVDGQYILYFWGNNTNLGTPTNQSRGFGYATSTDGINWDAPDDPIRVETGSSQGYELLEVVKLGDTFFAYYRELNGTDTSQIEHFVATSTDGFTFANDMHFHSGERGLIAATEHEGKIISIWLTADSGVYETAVSEDGINFVRVTTLEFPSRTIPYDITIEGDTAIIWNMVGVGNILWSYGNSITTRTEVPLDVFGAFDDPVVVEGGKGSEEIIGGSNDDDLSGDKGDDTIDAGAGDDVVSGGQGADVASGGTGDDYIDGGQAADLLFGDDGDDTILGGKGGDTLVGGAGDDTLSGGKGSDTFVFNHATEGTGHDTITDFKPGSDLLEITSAPQNAFGDLLILQDGSDTVIYHGAVTGFPDDPASYDSSITLEGVTATGLDADDFLFS